MHEAAQEVAVPAAVPEARVPEARGIVDADGQHIAAEQLLTLDVGLAANGMLPDALQP